MSAPFFIPFNFQPVNTGRSSTTYTVPAGFYAQVQINLAAYANATLANTDVQGLFTPINYNSDSESDSRNISLFLKAGDVITFNSSVASGTGNVSWSSVNDVRMASASAVSIITARLNGQDIATIYATASGVLSMDAISAAGSFNFVNFSGAVSGFVQYSEYAIIT